MSETPLLNPLMIAPITITTITPMATPRMVKAARALRARSGLGQKLAHDITAARAERLADADLAGPLGHRHQHDVHDHDAAHHQGHAHESRAHDIEDLAQLVPEIEHALRGHHGEVVVL